MLSMLFEANMEKYIKGKVNLVLIILTRRLI